MNSRRQFLVRAPIGLAGVLAACRKADALPAEGDVAGHARRECRAAAGRHSARDDSRQRAGAAVDPEARTSSSTRSAAPRPAQRIKPGTRIVSWTEDCFDGAVKTAADLPSKVMPPGHDNPQTGPFLHRRRGAGRHASPCTFVKLEPARTYARVVVRPGLRRARRHRRNRDARPRLSRDDVALRRRRGAERRARRQSRDGKHTWECRSRRSSAASASRRRAARCARTIVPGNFGGNMDCPEVRAGNTVFLGVNVPGALLSFGDGHYAMGDGEIMGAAIEGAMNVEVYVELIKKQRDAGAAHRERGRDHVRRLRPSARGRGACRVQGDGAWVRGRSAAVGDGRLSVRLAEREGADHSARGSGVHGAREDGEGAAAELDRFAADCGEKRGGASAIGQRA